MEAPENQVATQVDKRIDYFVANLGSREKVEEYFHKSMPALRTQLMDMMRNNYIIEQVQHSLQYAYRDRRNKKRMIRRLWITRINAAARINGLSYSKFMHGLKVAGIELDRKVLSNMAIEDAQGFAALAEIAKKAIA